MASDEAVVKNMVGIDKQPEALEILYSPRWICDVPDGVGEAEIDEIMKQYGIPRRLYAVIEGRNGIRELCVSEGSLGMPWSSRWEMIIVPEISNYIKSLAKNKKS